MRRWLIVLLRLNRLLSGGRRTNQRLSRGSRQRLSSKRFTKRWPGCVTSAITSSTPQRSLKRSSRNRARTRGRGADRGASTIQRHIRSIELQRAQGTRKVCIRRRQRWVRLSCYGRWNLGGTTRLKSRRDIIPSRSPTVQVLEARGDWIIRGVIVEGLQTRGQVIRSRDVFLPLRGIMKVL